MPTHTLPGRLSRPLASRPSHREDGLRRPVDWAKLGAATAGLALAVQVGAMAQPPNRSVDEFSEPRRQMVEEQIRARGVDEAGVLRAMEEVPRHLFMPEAVRDRAYFDGPQRIGSGQTISQPYVVALMTELRVLEIGTGSGYQAAILARLAKEVYTMEIREPLAAEAEATLERLGYDNVQVRAGDGYQGWPEEAPFDCIVVTAAPPEVPEELFNQLKVGGKMVVPVGMYFQDLLEITKTETGRRTRRVSPVRFVPMVSDPGD